MVLNRLLMSYAIGFTLALMMLSSCHQPRLVGACDAFPVKTGDLVRQYALPNGMIAQEFDTDHDGQADYAVVGPPEIKWPMFYMKGFDDPTVFNDPQHPFVAVIVYGDTGLEGRCADISTVFVRSPRPSPNYDTPTNKEVHELR